MSHHWSQAEPQMVASGEEVLRRLEKAGHQAYFVGGCVRDEMMGRPVHDMDIATSAAPEQVMALFDKTVPTGLAHGTVTVLLEGQSFEVTTFRKETGYTDHRRPSEVEFVDGIEEDLMRRDFTMNAIARSLEGALVDPFGGREDIKRGWIRCVGKPEERFEEDALRMIRAVRFASVFGFKPLKSLWRGLLNCRDGLPYIAVERIRSELERIVLGPRPLRGLALLARSGLLARSKAPLPAAQAGCAAPAASAAAIGGAASCPAAPAARLAALAALPAGQPALRWSLLLEALGVSAEEADPLLRSWTFPGALSRQITALLHVEEGVGQLLAATDGDRTRDGSERNSDPLSKDRLRRSWIQLQLAWGKEAAGMWVEREQKILEESLKHLSEEAGEQQPAAEFAKRTALTRRQDIVNMASIWHRTVPVHKVADLVLSAGEVMEAGGKRGGPWLGALMNELVHRVAAGDLPNEKQVLLQAVKERLSHE
ncbi:CCA tRNA nucleotidyltransferase [Paenibacillus caui]|uniref:CCA tRNA nucleotidyltransferase n=1 Tax=Paenibacillus caui TaxID=2873927 RepID=UPI002355EB67|nr:CCA tRNA nucleotidyltransferase [Paenibacillus caui]